MNKNVLDFLVIGAQKTGTTSLFKYLESHPQIHMPPEKEAPFFNVDERFSRGWEWYVREFFGNAPPDMLWGTVTPDYMADPRVPERIRSILPDVRLISLLRDPIERAYSHYLMGIRKGYETRSFENVVYDSLKADALEEARKQPTPNNSYIIRGEYGRILARYCELFPRDRMVVFLTEELKLDPGKVMQSIFQFLGVHSDFVPPNLGRIYHKGGSKRRLPWLEDLIKMESIRAIWKTIPGKYRRPIAYWFRQWNTVPDDSDVPIPPSVQELLVRHYAEDTKRLSALIGRRIPWFDCDE